MEDNHKGLAAAIIKQTIEDYQTAKNYEAKAIRKSNEINRQIRAEPKLVIELDGELDRFENTRTKAHHLRKEAEVFFKGEWFESLCELIELDPDYVRRKIKIIREGFHGRAGT